MTKFTDLGLSEPLLKALSSEGYTTPTPIQAKAIPAVLAGSDILGIAQTGTGKTAAFALPILNHLASKPLQAPRKGCRVLVISPTRELASQIADSFKAYSRFMQVSVTTVFGGVPKRPQIKALARGVDVLVATPGRLLDHVSERVIDLTGTEILVLDEADQMLDLGFVKPIRTIVSKLSSRRQTLFFSATMPKEISKLAGEFLQDPVKVAVTPVASTVDLINQRVIHIESPKKRALLAELLSGPDMSRTIVFTRTKRGADRVAKHLDAKGISVAAIHGNKSQRQREVALDAFRRSRISVLVATDIAARGIDVDAVSHVVNFDLPEVPEAYVHRIGRTARAGASGSAISLCDGAERKLLRSVERLIRQTIPSEDRRNDKELVAEKIVEKRSRSAGAGRPAGRGRFDNERKDAGRGGRNWRPEKQLSSSRSKRRGDGEQATGEQRRDRSARAGEPRSGSREQEGTSTLTNVSFLAGPPLNKGNGKRGNGSNGANGAKRSGGHKADGAGTSRGSRNGETRSNRKRRRQQAGNTASPA